MDLGTILTLLVILFAIVGPVIEKKLKQAGKIVQARQFREIMDTVTGSREDDEQETAASPSAGAAPAVRPDTVGNVDANHPVLQDIPQELLEGGYRSVKDIIADRRKRSAGTKPAAGPVKKLEIDPKKLVIYSEIMKPKF